MDHERGVSRRNEGNPARENRQLAREAARAQRRREHSAAPRATDRLKFSVAFFSSAANAVTSSYALQFMVARHADEHGYDAIWTPERHFEEFGAAYPNPSVLSAALAVVTQRISIRGGSCILPLHHPIRVAEEWALVDRLSNGRAGLGLGSGWHFGDFVLAPQAFENRRALMHEGVEIIQRLWRGEAVPFAAPDGRLLPVRIRSLPVSDHIPIWFASSGTEETWTRAAEMGAGIYTAFPDDDLDFERRIGAYKARARASGHQGSVVVMVHTYVGASDAEARRAVEAPLRTYLTSFMQQRLRAQKLRSADFAPPVDELERLVDEAFDSLVAHRSMVGSVATCVKRAQMIRALGVDEVACLIDFGLDATEVMAGLERLDDVVHHCACELSAQ